MTEEERIKSNDELAQVQQVSVRKIQKRNLGDILVDAKLVSSAQLQSALQEQKRNSSQKLGEILVEQAVIKQEELLKALAYQLDLQYYERLPFNDIDPRLVDQIPISFCKDNKVVPIARDDFNVTVAVSDPLNIYPLDDLRLILSTNIVMVVSSEAVINQTINRVYERAGDSSNKALQELNVDIEDAGVEVPTKDLLEAGDDEKPIIRLVNGLLSKAVKDKASDIHIEPYETEVIVRFRVDGSLKEEMRLQKVLHNNLSSRIKIIGSLNIAEKRVPQDGRISIRVAGKEIDVRLSVLPTSQGERIVMRLLDKSAGAKRLDEMGIDSEIAEKWDMLVNQKHGIVLVTGPTGSGKSTLLYASLMAVSTPDINILTIEDPVEYRLAGVSQIQANPKVGLTFAEGLRSILRQDPDVIMIGEIRDKETAQIAVQSSMTGHLVFSTLHTNDTATAVTRLMDFEIEPFQISSAVLGVMATRLVRRLCLACKEPHEPTEKELEILGVTLDKLVSGKIYREGPGCDACSQRGYAGRLGVHELLILDDDMKDIILKTQDGQTIKRAALERGMKTLRDSAMQKVIQGHTSLEEAIQKTQTDHIE